MEALTQLTVREDIPEEARWDLDGLYVEESLWKKDFERLEKDISGYESFKGSLANSAEKIKRCIEFDISVTRRIEKLYTYAHLRNDQDKTHAKNQENFEKVVRLHTLTTKLSSYIPSELMSIPEDRIEKFLADKELAFYKFHLERILRHRKHTLSEREEELLASARRVVRWGTSIL